MPHQVLARKWRPRKFAEMVGQEHILHMLANALTTQRLHHAYLFTGTRGVGKTTLARLLAKCLNCEKGISPNPCGECSICESIDAGRFLDLIEIDAASRTKVEDTRDILDNVPYPPTVGRFKIYLIDEVHMLSGHSFNALLKTLEEPPAHVKFLLATTEPKRLPITILSRCLQFNLKRVNSNLITERLKKICEAEQIQFEINALSHLAEAADGSLRDALSLLDQAIAFCGANISLTQTREMLGNVAEDSIYQLLNALADQEGQALLAAINQLAEYSPNFSYLLEDILNILHRIVRFHIAPEQASHEKIKELAAKISPSDAQVYYQMALLGKKDLPLAFNPQQGFEMALLRMLAFKVVEEKKMSEPASKIPLTKENPKVEKPIPAMKTEKTSLAKTNNWTEMLPRLGLSGMAYALASNCTLTAMDNSKIELSLSEKHAAMLNPKLTERLEQAFSQYLERPIKLDIKLNTEVVETPAQQLQQEKEVRHMQALNALENDSQVKKMMDLFGATIDPDSIQASDPAK